MDSRVYYGEYSLKHWINMLLSKNIILPKYQRSFVWDEKDVLRLLKSIQEGQFVQPVTIALYKIDGLRPGQNLIIDGQQRLSSILLAYLGYMPIKGKFEKGGRGTGTCPKPKNQEFTKYTLNCGLAAGAYAAGRCADNIR